MTYQFDNDNFDFKKVTTSVSRLVWRTVWWLLGTLALASLCYVFFSFFLNTEYEKKLSRENRKYEKMYRELVEQQQLIEDVAKGLATRDNGIYRDIFQADAPAVDPLGSMDLVMYSDTVSDENRVKHAASRLAVLGSGVSMVEANFAEIFRLLVKNGIGNMPVDMPVEEMSYAQAGASVGTKYNAIYKVNSLHAGLDIIAAQGSEVRAAADGTVTEVTRSGKGLGNVISIDHGNGYVTRYAHLSEISVRKGQAVRKGSKIATVGISGQTYAPHLHYEVLRDGEPVDPVDYMFASLSPYDYANVAYISGSTRQSLD